MNDTQKDSGMDWLEAELADTLDEDYELELREPALSLEIRKIYRKASIPTRSTGIDYFRNAAAASGRTDQAAGLGAAHRREDRRHLRGPRQRRQGRRHQAHHPAPQPARRPRRGAAGAQRPREDPVVFPALRAAPAGGRRDRAVRPLLVQPRRRRAGHGLRHRGPGRAVLPRRAGIRADAGALRHPADQVLVLDHRRGAADAVPDAHPRPAEAVEALPDGPAVPGALGAVHQGQGGDVRPHQHPRGALVHRRGQRQEAGAAELHRPPAQPDPLRAGAARGGHACPSGSSTQTTSAPCCRRSFTSRRSTEGQNPSSPRCGAVAGSSTPATGAVESALFLCGRADRKRRTATVGTAPVRPSSCRGYGPRPSPRGCPRRRSGPGP